LNKSLLLGLVFVLVVVVFVFGSGQLVSNNMPSDLDSGGLRVDLCGFGVDNPSGCDALYWKEKQKYFIVEETFFSLDGVVLVSGRSDGHRLSGESGSDNWQDYRQPLGLGVVGCGKHTFEYRLVYKRPLPQCLQYDGSYSQCLSSGIDDTVGSGSFVVDRDDCPVVSGDVQMNNGFQALVDLWNRFLVWLGGLFA